jgi:hypothetical protein
MMSSNRGTAIKIVTPDELNKLLKRYDARLEDHARHLRDLRRFENEVSMDRQLQAQQELNDKLQGHLQSYANLIIGLGYAGFFALWNMVEKSIPAPAHALAGLLIGASLIVFVGYEVARTIWTSVCLRRQAKVLRGASGRAVPTIGELVDMHEDLERRARKPWLAVVVVTIITAGAAAGIVIWHLSAQLAAKIA